MGQSIDVQSTNQGLVQAHIGLEDLDIRVIQSNDLFLLLAIFLLFVCGTSIGRVRSESNSKPIVLSTHTFPSLPLVVP